MRLPTASPGSAGTFHCGLFHLHVELSDDSLPKCMRSRGAQKVCPGLTKAPAAWFV